MSAALRRGFAMKSFSEVILFTTASAVNAALVIGAAFALGLLAR